MRTQIRVHLPTASPAQAILRHVLGRIPRLADVSDGARRAPLSNPSLKRPHRPKISPILPLPTRGAEHARPQTFQQHSKSRR